MRDWGKSRREREAPAFVKTTTRQAAETRTKSGRFSHKKIIMTKSRGKSDDKHNYIENWCSFVFIPCVQAVQSVSKYDR